MKNIAVILAGGSGTRFDQEQPKQFTKIAGLSIIEHTIKAFQQHLSINEIIIVTKDGYQEKVYESVNRHRFDKVSKVLAGGEQRSDSSLAAINSIKSEAGADEYKILFHDAVRPFISDKVIQACLDALDQFDAVDVAIPATDTIIKCENSLISEVPDRSKLKFGQTPQGFRLRTIQSAYQKALSDPNFKTTDDCGVVVKYLPNTEVKVVEGDQSNIKITHKQDIHLADKIFQLKSIEHSKIYSEDYYYQGLKGRTLVVFGGSEGIGRSVVELGLRFGAKVESFSRKTNNVDVSDMASVEEAFKQTADKHGKIDYVVNTAAILTKKSIANISQQEILNGINVNLLGTINTVKAAEPYIRSTRGSFALFTSSSYTRGRANYSIYSSTKAAIVNFTQAIAEEWSDYGIRINCINPERTKTPMRVTNFGFEPEGSLLTSEKVALATANTLISSQTGQVIDVRIGTNE